MIIVRWQKVSIAVLAGFILLGSSFGADWPHWRGPHYDGHSSEKGFKTSWDGDLPAVWTREIGAGYSGISIVKGRVYTCGTSNGKQVLLCLDATTGKPIWEQPFEDGYNNSFGNGTRGTPTVHKGRVYVMGARGKLACFRADNGAEIWSHKYDRVPQWGYSGSVLIQGKLAIAITGGKDGSLRAFDKKTGKEVWKCGSDKDPGYSTPYPFTFKGTKYVCSFFGNNVVIVEPSTGREVLSMPWKTAYKVNAATPIFHEGYLFLSSGYQTGCGLYKLSKKGDKLEAQEVWRSKVLLNKFQTPVLHEGKLYSFDQKAFKCVDFMSGKELWKKRGKHGTLILADGHLIALTGEGRLQIAKALPSGFDPTGEANILDNRCWTVPTLSDGRLYARNFDRIVCIDLRG